MRAGSMFAGCGGLDLGLIRAGFHVVWHAEIHPQCSTILDERFPGIPNLGDVTTVLWGDEHAVDVIAAGFPCQPFSVAGKRKQHQDERFLWYEVWRAVATLRPRHVLLENVAGLLNGSWFDEPDDRCVCGRPHRWGGMPLPRQGSAGKSRRRDDGEGTVSAATDGRDRRGNSHSDEGENGDVGSSVEVDAVGPEGGSVAGAGAASPLDQAGAGGTAAAREGGALGAAADGVWPNPMDGGWTGESDGDPEKDLGTEPEGPDDGEVDGGSVCVSCGRPVGDSATRPVFRSGAHTVLGSLAALGYDCRWSCLRAADVGAPHGRLRWFCVATDAELGRVDTDRRLRRGGQGAPHGSAPAPLLAWSDVALAANVLADRAGAVADPERERSHWGRRRDARGAAAVGQHGGPELEGHSVSAPDPGGIGSCGSEGVRGVEGRRSRVDGEAAPDAGDDGRVGLASGDGADGGVGVERGDDADGRGVADRGPHGARGAASAADAEGARAARVSGGDGGLGAVGGPGARAGGRDRAGDPAQGVPVVGGGAGVVEVGGADVEASADAAGGGRVGRPGLAGRGDAEDGGAAERVEGVDPAGDGDRHDAVAWGVYEPAVRRWEWILGRPAPAPTDARGRLTPEFVEWMMGFPAGWTAARGVKCAKRLFVLGNAVQVQCAQLIAEWLLQIDDDLFAPLLEDETLTTGGQLNG